MTQLRDLKFKDLQSKKIAKEQLEMSRDIAEKTHILSVNDAFYKYFRTGNFDAMSELWHESDQVSVVHPNWPVIDGYEDVMDSWFRIMVEGVPPKIFPENPIVLQTGNTAIVYCEENLGSNRTIASNIFRKVKGQWKLVQHVVSSLPDPE